MKRKIMIAVIMLVLTVAFDKGFSQGMQSDTAKMPNGYWGSLGLGETSLGFFTGRADANAELSDGYLIAGSAQVESSSVFGGTEVDSYDILFGKIFKQGISMFTLSAGLGLVNVTTKSSTLFSTAPQVTTSQTGIGLPIVIQGYLVAGQTFGFGVSGFLNLNTVKTTAGVMFSLAIGRLATHKK